MRNSAIRRASPIVLALQPRAACEQRALCRTRSAIDRKFLYALPVNGFDEDEPSGVFDAPPEVETLSADERARIIAGRYEIIERLGAGGMGQVLRVRHRRLGKAFALKVMH